MPRYSPEPALLGKVIWSVALSLFLPLLASTFDLQSFLLPAAHADSSGDSRASSSSSSSSSSSTSLTTPGGSSAELNPAYDPLLDTTPALLPPSSAKVRSAPPTVAPALKGNRLFPSPVGGPGASVFPASASSTTIKTGLDATTLKTGTDSTTLKTGTDSTTLQTGANNTTLQVGTQSTTLQTGTDSALLKTGVERQVEPLNILFILDGSRSMLEPLERGVQKIDAAKQVLQNALSRIPADVNLGLRVFGQGYGGAGASANLFAGGFGGVDMTAECRNTALWVPIGKGNRRSIIEKVRELKPYGMTPLAYSIAQAAFSDFRGLQGNKVIILITDGADTCNGNPCEVIEKLLPRFGINIKVDVVGLSMHREPDARKQLNCIAEKSGGKYSDAKTAADLIDSVSASVSKAIEGRVIIRPSSTGPAGGGTTGAPARGNPANINPNNINPINTTTPQETGPIEREILKSLPH